MYKNYLKVIINKNKYNIKVNIIIKNHRLIIKVRFKFI